MDIITKNKSLQQTIDNLNNVINLMKEKSDEYYSSKIKAEKDVYDLKNKLEKKNKKNTCLEEIIKSQQEVIEFLTTQKFSAENIEFAAIKRYRGWDCLYLNGQKVNTDRSSDITIHCGCECVRIENEVV